MFITLVGPDERQEPVTVEVPSTTVITVDTITELAQRDYAWSDRLPGESVPAWRHRTRSFPHTARKGGGEAML